VQLGLCLVSTISSRRMSALKEHHNPKHRPGQHPVHSVNTNGNGKPFTLAPVNTAEAKPQTDPP